ncbi:hypothetical protein BDZ97DRAFT_1920440 [Flammula alnicola]|nr:hypothetical protein BDZ97DRAFT_1920440 [Flammula alnicola]
MEIAEKSNPDFPINIVDRQASVRTFSELVKEGRLDDARKIMLDFVECHPAGGNMDLFRQLRSIVIHSDDSDISLVLELGVALASRGFVDFVKDEISPVIEEFGTPAMLSQFELILEELYKTKSRSPQSANVFEEYSDDYTTILSKFPQPQPSILELVQGQLPALLPEHPTNDMSIFEEEGIEYSIHASTNTQDHPSNPSAKVLVELLEGKRYDRAYQLLKEMKTLDTSIPPSHMFEVAALDVLCNSTLPPPEKTEQNTLPDLTSENYECRSTSTLCSNLASKGYANHISGQFLRSIIRYSSAEQIKAFIQEFERRNRDYWLGYQPVRALREAKHTSQNIRGMAVRFLTYSGRVQEAISMLPDPNDRTFRFTVFTYDILLERLRRSPYRGYQKFIPLVETLRSQREVEAAQIPAVFHSTANDLATSHMTSAEVALPSSPLQDPENLSMMLRYLRKALISEPQSLHPFVLATFMEAYLATGRTRALKMLLDKALRKSFSATKAFVFAEMHYYRHLGQHDLVIKAFVEHFYLSGVPREEVQNWYDNIESQNQQYDPQIWEETRLTRISGFHPGIVLPFGKTWPDREQCTLVWECLVASATTDDAVKYLYDKFRYFAREGQDIPTNPDIASVDPLPVPKRLRSNVAPAAFTPFMHRLIPILGPEFGGRMLNDMWSVHIKPTIHHYTELLGFYSKRGLVGEVFAILDQLERGKMLKKEVELPPHQRNGASGKKTYTKKIFFAEPDLPFYVSLIRGFIISNNVKAAEEIFRRLQRRTPCPPGKNRHLDRAMRDLQSQDRAAASISESNNVSPASYYINAVKVVLHTCESLPLPGNQTIRPVPHSTARSPDARGRRIAVIRRCREACGRQRGTECCR